MFSTLEEVEKPVPNDNQLLVKVRAAAVNPLDLTIRGTVAPCARCLACANQKTLAWVSTMPEQLKRLAKTSRNFKPGDEVFGGKTGAFADTSVYLADRAVVLKPANMTFEQAASVPVAAITALQGLRDKGKIQAGQKVLDQRRVGRRGHVRGANREIVRHRSDRRLQHAECRSCPIDRRGPRD